MSRPAIAAIIAGSGVIEAGGAAAGDVAGELVALAGKLVPGMSAASVAAGEQLGEALSEHFRLAQDKVATRDVAVAYETAGRALVLALHATNWTLAAAFDTASGAGLEAKKAMTLVAPPLTLTLALTDVGPSAARIAATSHHPGLDWLKFNDGALAALFAQVDVYLARFTA